MTNEELRHWAKLPPGWHGGVQEAVLRVLDELAASRKALQPFADAADAADAGEVDGGITDCNLISEYEMPDITVDQLRAARSALKGGE